ncbi:MAG: hypothetical protein KDC83_15165 [Flavobacteriales bacterium]|nr:hypothetical protein [Flavobacteriales bacterium]
MKNVKIWMVFSFFGLFISHLNAQVIKETLIDVSETRSCLGAYYYHQTPSHHIIISSEENYDPNFPGKRGCLDYRELEKQILLVQKDSLNIDSAIYLGRFPSMDKFISLSNQSLIGISILDTVEVDYAKGTETTNNGLISVGFDLITNEPFFIGMEPHLHATELLEFKELGGLLYILYATEVFGINVPRYNSYLEVRGLDFTLINRYQLNRRIITSDFDAVNLGFIILTEVNENTPEILTLEQLSLSGDLTIKNQSVTISARAPGFVALNDKVCTYSPNLLNGQPTLEVYDGFGIQLNQILVDAPVDDILVYQNYYVVVYGKEDRMDPSPIRFKIYSELLYEIYDSGWKGFATVEIDDAEVIDDAFLISGSTSNHFGDHGPAEKDKMYVMSVDLLEALNSNPIATPNEEIVITPNPVNEKILNLFVPGIDFNFYPDSQITLTSANGQEYKSDFKRIDSHNISLEISFLKEGVNYVYLRTDKGGLIGKKFIVN